MKVLMLTNRRECNVAWIGTIKVKIFDGIVKILCNVKHVHGHERNLISLDRPYSMNYGYYTKGGVII